MSSMLELRWHGPFRYGAKGLEAIGDGPHWATTADLAAVSGQPGIYLFCVDHPIHGPQCLAYIGKSSRVGSRLNQHDNWLRDEWGVSVYVARCPDEYIQAVEALLIYAHSPIYNASGVGNARAIPSDLHVRNVGRFWGLFPDVLASHPWHRQAVT